MRELGGSSDIVSGGFIYNDYNSKLRFPESIDVYDEMRKSDPIVAAGLRSCKQPILSTDYGVQPGSEDERDLEIADFVASVFGIDQQATSPYMSWHDFLRHILLIYDYGFMYFEKVYAKVDDKWIFWKLAPRMPESIIKFTTNKSTPGIEQIATVDAYTPKEQIRTVSIPQEKLFHIAYDQEGYNLTGISLLRAAYKPWYLKDTFEKIQAIGMERHANGIPTAKRTEVGADNKEDAEQTKQTLQNMRENSQAYLDVPYGMDFMFTTIEHELPDIDKPIERQSQEIAIALQSKWLTTGIANGGYSQSKNETDFLTLSLEGNVNYILDKVNYLVKEMVDLNYENVENYPKIIASELGQINIGDFSLAIERFAKSGLMLKDPTAQNIMRKNLGLPPLEDEEFEKFQEEEKEKEEKQEEKIIEKKKEKEEEEEKMSKKKLSVSAKQKELDFMQRITENENKIQDNFSKVTRDFDAAGERMKKFIKKQYAKAKTKEMAGETVFDQAGNMQIMFDIDKYVKNEFKKLRSKYGRDHGKRQAELAYNRGKKVKLKGNTSWSIRGYLMNIGKVFDRAPTNITEKVNDHFGTFAVAAVANKQIDNIVDKAVNNNDLRLSYETYPRSAFKQAILEDNPDIENWKMVAPEEALKRYSAERPKGFTMENVFKIGTLGYWASKRDDENANPLIFPIHPNSLDYYMPVNEEDLEEQEQMSREQRKTIKNLSHIRNDIKLAIEKKDRAELKRSVYKLHNYKHPREKITIQQREELNEKVDKLLSLS